MCQWLNPEGNQSLELTSPYGTNEIWSLISSYEWSTGKYWWINSWWWHQMETFSTLLAICAGNSPVTGEFPSQRPVTQSFDVFFDLRLNKWLSKQSWCWWFETPSCQLWLHCNVIYISTLNTLHCIDTVNVHDIYQWPWSAKVWICRRHLIPIQGLYLEVAWNRLLVWYLPTSSKWINH